MTKRQNGVHMCGVNVNETSSKEADLAVAFSQLLVVYAFSTCNSIIMGIKSDKPKVFSLSRWHIPSELDFFN